MNVKRTVSGTIIGGVLTLGAVDASVLNEQPIERVEQVGEERVEAKQIGDRVETTFPWKDQSGLKVVADLGEPTIGERMADKRKKEVITEVVDFGEGGFKVDILLNEKPDTNVFCYAIEGAENYDFFYQPPLTEEEIAEGAERPEDIIGSYAVYHKQLKNHVVGQENYATGKVMHIPRPQVWSLTTPEEKEWAELSYEEGELCVTVRQGILDEAEYPVRVDPTFGYTSIGATSFSVASADQSAALNATLPGSGDITSITWYQNGDFSPSQSLRAGLYSDAGSAPDALEGSTNTTSIDTTPPGWFTFTFPSPVSLSAGVHWIAIHTPANSASTLGDSGAGNIVRLNPDTFADGLESPWSGGSALAYAIPIYATYTAAAASTPPQDVIFFD